MPRRKEAGANAGPNIKQTSRIDHNKGARPKLRGDQCQCSACGQLFACVGTFDRHRIGYATDRRCLCFAEMLAKGMDSQRARVLDSWPSPWIRFYADAVRTADAI